MLKISERQSIGFITVRLHPEHGYYGGLLLINHLARPLEFHCTLPLKPSRAQSILYGTTLDEFVCGEQIGRALALKAKATPTAFFSDSPAVLSLRNLISEPVVLVDTKSLSESASASHLQIPSGAQREFRHFQVAGQSLSVHTRYHDDADLIEAFWQEMNPQVDLREPFGRISEALLEAHPATKAA